MQSDKWVLQVAILMTPEADWDDVNERADRVIGEDAQDYGAGTGFGIRDREWVFPSQKAAYDALLRLRDEFQSLLVGANVARDDSD